MVTQDRNAADRAMPGRDGNPFHRGEIEMHMRLGMQEKMDDIGRRVIRQFMPDQHREFFEDQRYLFLGSVDGAGQPWATLLADDRPIASSPDPRHLNVTAPSNAYDAALQGVCSGKTVGLLGLEFSSRRRNRVNGRVISSGPNGFAIKVGQSFGNCPKYIQSREVVGVGRASTASLITAGAELSPRDRQLVGGADTFFIASTSGDEGGLAAGVDVSHRGGNPGFVRLVSSTEFLVPDFTGNFLFNTLGNILLEPRVGLLFVDWSDGTLLQIAAEAEIIWDGPDVDAYAGAKRALRFRVSKAVRIRPAVQLHWSKGEQSPFAAKLGPWRPA